MTVKELLEHLRNVPFDYKVKIDCTDSNCSVEIVFTEKDSECQTFTIYADLKGT